MIIIDAVDAQRKADSPYAGPTIRLPDQVSLRSLPTSLPDYDTSQKVHKELVEDRWKGRFGGNFWRGVLVAFIVYVILGVGVGVPLAVMKLRADSKTKPFTMQNTPVFDFWGSDDSSSPLPLQALRDTLFETDIRCNVWNTAESSSSHPLLLATTRHKLPPLGLVTVRSNVSYDAGFFTGINGSLTVKLNENKKERDVVFIVNVWTSSVETRKRTTVCFADAGPNRGLTIYTPAELDEDEFLSVTVQVLLPSSSFIDTFITYLPQFSQHFGNLAGGISFNRLGIEGTNNIISCGSLAGTQISVKNVLASIKGTFNVTNRLSLDTVRGAITANVTLTQAMSALQPTFLSLDTGYSPIDANVTLSTQKPVDGFGPPCFVTHVKTFNGDINLDISHADDTPKSTLSLQVQNALAESKVQLDSKFRGTFNVQTKLDQVTVRNHTATPAPPKPVSTTSTLLPLPGSPAPTSPSDPHPDVRTVQYDTLTTSKAVGWVGYGRRTPNTRTPGQSQVDIISSLGPVVFDLG